ncbi:hypothetical protein GCM10007190_12410 [Macrococcus hajekii]|nr:hypothetical protein GCM10007190_12410 [Macrococcus hajekii]
MLRIWHESFSEWPSGSKGKSDRRVSERVICTLQQKKYDCTFDEWCVFRNAQFRWQHGFRLRPIYRTESFYFK